ncbi:hypothetical protein Pan44_09700 [Caulifigura coniformis]|uniref:Uncharacterized protein n=1 Tax=Caulifigura coniformis TaxID=2527983 RepID=A0A517SA48_9PLAN|nr:hypothetical protein [Caulifigura coniformis]QDT52956.1 hypothetical protein Pan44_09700 [Caulifigura coniformis]
MPSQRFHGADITDQHRELLGAAEEIWFVDPHHGTGQDARHPWMELVVSVPPPIPDVVDPSAAQTDPAIIEIEVDSTNHHELNQLRERVNRLCGRPAITPPHATGSP